MFGLSTKSHPKMSTKCHPKRGLFVDKSVYEMSPKVSMRCHLFCPRDITDYVHEMSATLFKTVNLSYAHIPVFLRELKIHIFPLQNYNLKCKTFWNEILRWIGLMLLWVLVLYSCVGFQEVSHLTWKKMIYFLLG